MPQTTMTKLPGQKLVVKPLGIYYEKLIDKQIKEAAESLSGFLAGFPPHQRWKVQQEILRQVPEMIRSIDETARKATGP